MVQEDDSEGRNLAEIEILASGSSEFIAITQGMFLHQFLTTWTLFLRRAETGGSVIRCVLKLLETPCPMSSPQVSVETGYSLQDRCLLRSRSRSCPVAAPFLDLGAEPDTKYRPSFA